MEIYTLLMQCPLDGIQTTLQEATDRKEKQNLNDLVCQKCGFTLQPIEWEK
jgi:hypothetical protein